MFKVTIILCDLKMPNEIMSPRAEITRAENKKHFFSGTTNAKSSLKMVEFTVDESGHVSSVIQYYRCLL